MRYKKVGNQILDTTDGTKYDPENRMFRKRAQNEAVGGNPELYELIIGKPKQRMAGEQVPPELDALIAEIRGKEQSVDAPGDELLGDAIRYLNQRYDAMEEAGLPRSMAAMMDGQVSLPNTDKAPQEVRLQISPGVEQRVHTTYTKDVNPLTGQKDIVPYRDPVTGAAMVTNLGRGADMQGYVKASEYVQQQLGRLAGLKIEANHGSDRYATDFRNGDIKIDGETTRPSWRERGDAVQAYTKVVDADNPNAPANRMAPAIKATMQDIIRQNPNASIQDVIAIAGDRLDGGMYKGEVQPPMEGKVLDKSKDGILLTILSDKDHELNKQVRDTIPVPVQGALYQDLNGMRRTLGDITGRELSRGLQVRPNYGNNRNGEARGRVYVTPSPKRAQEFTVDMSQIQPRVAQLFDYKQ